MSLLRTPQLLLETAPKELRLTILLREYDKVAWQYAVEQLDHSRYLLRLSELELLDRERRATERRIRQAKFPLSNPGQLRLPGHPSLNKPWCWSAAVRVTRPPRERPAAGQQRHR